MAIYNAYLEGAERDAAILSMEMDNQYDKLSMLYEMTLMELAQVKKDIELKVFRESGTYDDLEYLISEAEAQAAQDQTNVLSQILQWFANAIQKMITGIKNFFAGSKDIPDDTEAQVELPEKETEMFTKINGILNSVAGMDGKITMDGVLKIVGGALGIGGTLAGLGAVWNKFDQDHKIKARIMKWGAVKAVNAACNKSVGALNKIITDVINKIQDTTVGKFICDQILRPIQQRCDNIINICNGAIQTFKANVGKVAGNAKAAVTNAVNGGEVKVASQNRRANVLIFKLSNGGSIKYNLDNGSHEDTNVDKATADKLVQANNAQIEAAKKALEADKAKKAANNAKTDNAKPIQMGTTQQTQPQAAAPAGTNAVTPPAGTESASEEVDGEFTFEYAEDGSVEITYNETLDVESVNDFKTTMESIFGMVAEEEANEDPELKELQDFFGEF